MNMIELPQTDILSSQAILGLMRIGLKTDKEVQDLYQAARESGINFFDHADIYWETLHGCEERFAQALKLKPAEREEIYLQTKVGIVKDVPYFDFSYEHLMSSVEGSLKALETDYIDALLLHRPDALVEPEEVARAFDELESSGKVRHFGVSNHTPRQIELLETAVKQPLAFNQIQISLPHAPVIAQGLAMNMADQTQAVTLDGGGIVDFCRINDITIQAWSPFQAGFFTGTFIGSDDYPELNRLLDQLAQKYGVTPSAIAYAWLTRHPAQMQVILGTTNPDRLRAITAGDFTLTRREWYELFIAAGYLVP